MLVLTERIEFDGPVTGFVSWFVPRTPVGLFDAWGPIPGVAEVLNQSAEWTLPGSTRTLRLTDGSRIGEVVLEFRPEGMFRYRMHGFSGLMNLLVDQIEGEWRGEDLGEARGRISWTYRFHDRNAIACLALFVMSPAWRGYMRASLRRVEKALPKRGTR